MITPTYFERRIHFFYFTEEMGAVRVCTCNCSEVVSMKKIKHSIIIVFILCPDGFFAYSTNLFLDLFNENPNYGIQIMSEQKMTAMLILVVAEFC